ncbi:unnamed protein product [Soboliphyme baturini]|uniref:REJ domain-containing protein n=1 Tax=Soboliphyme baturini TaxID=241478 RepID=A0A183IVT7_9BILA|nr:unnamed protein product [Soboliphyme baturini]
MMARLFFLYLTYSEGKLADVGRTVHRYSLDVLADTEACLPRKGTLDLQYEWSFSWLSHNTQRRAGEGILLTSTVSRKAVSVEQVSIRILACRANEQATLNVILADKCTDKRVE